MVKYCFLNIGWHVVARGISLFARNNACKGKKTDLQKQDLH